MSAGITPPAIGGVPQILDLKAINEQGQSYNIDLKVRRFSAWSARGTLYLARMLSEQPVIGDGDHTLKAVIGIPLLDVALFAQPAHAEQGG